MSEFVACSPVNEQAGAHWAQDPVDSKPTSTTSTPGFLQQFQVTVEQRNSHRGSWQLRP